MKIYKQISWIFSYIIVVVSCLSISISCYADENDEWIIDNRAFEMMDEFALGFCDGYAWVPLVNILDNSTKKIAINSQGEITITTEDELSFWGQFHNGYSILADYIIVNTEGDVVWTADVGLNKLQNRFPSASIKWCGFITKYLGHAIIAYEVDDYYESGTYWGAITPDGTWLQELSKQEIVFKNNIFQIEQGYYCPRNGCLYPSQTEAENADIQAKNDGYSYDIFNYIADEESEYFREFDKDGNEVYCIKFNDIISFYGYSKGYWAFLVADEYNKSRLLFVSCNGEVVESIYTQGAIKYSDGLIWAKSYKDDSYVCLNNQGNILFEGIYQPGEFHNGIALVCDENNNYSYIDTDGNSIL